MRTERIYCTDDHEGHWLTDEEIVRCRDCEHLYVITYDCYVCDLYKDKLMPFVELDDFCSHGKRREENV